MNSLQLRKTALALAAMAMVFGSAPAAAVSYDLSLTDVGGFGAGPYATVELTQDTGEVDVVVTLADHFKFVNTGGPHTPFAFNLNTGAYSVVGVSAGFSWADSSSGNSPFGTFSDGIGIDAANGFPGSKFGPLEFSVTGVTLANFVTNAGGYLFSADLLYQDPALKDGFATGAVANGEVVPGIPEPSTYAVMFAGLGAIGFMARRRRQG